jgi:Uma2 family endonuclease
LASKHADYFEAGTLVVWDVDANAQCENVYRSDAPDKPVRLIAGQTANVEPAVPGWRMAVDRIFA